MSHKLIGSQKGEVPYGPAHEEELACFEVTYTVHSMYSTEITGFYTGGATDDPPTLSMTTEALLERFWTVVWDKTATGNALRIPYERA